MLSEDSLQLWFSSTKQFSMEKKYTLIVLRVLPLSTSG